VFSRRLAQERIPYERPKKPRFVPRKPLRGLWGVVPEGAPAGIPARYGLEPLNAIIPSGERLLLIYGGRHVFSVIQGRVEKAFDLAALLHPPDPGLRDAHYAEQDLLFAEVAGDTLYACNAGDVFAQFVRDRKGHLTALDFATGQLLWRSEPRTCSSMFLVVGDYLISAYGEAIKDNQAVLVRRADGQRLGKVTIRDAEPEELILEGRRLILVDGFRRHVFELREATAP